MKNPILIMILLVGFMLLIGQYALASIERVYVSGSCSLEFGVNEGFTLISYENNSVTFIVQSGEINSSISAISVYSARGRLTLNSVNASTVTASSPNDENFDLRIDEGSSIMYENRTYVLSVPAGRNVIISWKFYVPNPIDEYFMLGLGLVGVGMMIFSPCWVTWEIKKHGVSDVAVERFGYAMLMFIIGFGLIVTYLWS